MRVAALYDVHGNLPALEAVLADVRRAGVDRIVVGGDVVPGPMPAATVARLAALDVPLQCIHGNGERIVLGQRADGDIREVPERHRDVIRWTAAQLDSRDASWLAEWPGTLTLGIEGIGDVLFCHATPRNDTDIFTRLTDEAKLLPLFRDIDAPLVVCGHTHMQFDRTVGAVRVVNAGSVGMPFAGPPGAYWLLLGPGVELRRTAYDVTGAAEQMRRTTCPMVEELSVRYVLDPPDEANTLALFAPAELR
jgi:predicted phosphodiesterase